MTYNGTIYRPPTEANTFLIPITEGCTHNSCHFCNMYQNIPFRMLPLSETEKYLLIAKKSYGEYSKQIRRVYLVGADPFALSAKNLLERIDLIREDLPNAAVFTMYARTDNIASKSDEDLDRLSFLFFSFGENNKHLIIYREQSTFIINYFYSHVLFSQFSDQKRSEFIC